MNKKVKRDVIIREGDMRRKKKKGYANGYR